MNKEQRESNKRTWLAVYKKELILRRKFLRQKPKIYKEIFGRNPKGISEKECVKGHVWVPATHLWIHDGSRGSVKLFGHMRRGFREAYPYKAEGKIIQPQICWNCIKAREAEREDLSFRDRQLQQSVWRFQQKGVRKRGRKPKYTKKVSDRDLEEILG